MPDQRITANQRRAQAFEANTNIMREARWIQAGSHDPLTLDEAVAKVFGDPLLLAKCHDVAPIGSFPRTWTEPDKPIPPP